MTENILSPIYANGVKIENLVEALQDVNHIDVGQRVASEERFWSTPTRDQNSTTSEVFEISFGSLQKINYVSFMLANFPHHCVAQWWNADNGTWNNFTFEGSRTSILKFSIFNSIPSVINPSLAPYVVHPQHYGAGHWKSFNSKTSPVETGKIRLLLTRQTNGQAPSDPFGQVLPYSLGVKDFDCGYLIENKNDIPFQNAKPTIRGEKLSFGSTKDLLGSSVDFALREQKASDLLNEKTWRCAPQPAFNSVVSLYVDARDDFNQAQVIDRFAIDPLYTGPRLNLYYSNDEISGIFEGSDDPIGYPDVVGWPGTASSIIYSGNLSNDCFNPSSPGTIRVVDPTGLPLGVYEMTIENEDVMASYPSTLYPLDPNFIELIARELNGTIGTEHLTGAPVVVNGAGSPGGVIEEIRITPNGLIFTGTAGLSIPNRKIQLDSTQPFSVAMSIEPLFDSTWSGLSNGLSSAVNGEVITFFDNGALRIALVVDPVSLEYSGIRFGSGNEYLDLNLPFSRSDVLNFIAISNGETIEIHFNELKSYINISGSSNNDIKIGGNSSLTEELWQLNQMCIKQLAMSSQDVDSFMADPSFYVQKPQFAQDDTGTTANSLFRIHPNFQTTGHNSPTEFGILGGPPNLLSLITWIPINRDFSLRKGFLEFEPVNAKYFKFEFTDLVAENYEVVGNVGKTTKFFPMLPGEKPRIFIPKNSGHQGGSGVAIMNNIFASQIYPDSYRTEYLRQFFQPNSPYTANEVIYSKNPDVAERLRQLGTYYNFAPWLPETIRQRFTETQVHNYENRKVFFKQKVAYFAGLKSLVAYRVNYASGENTARYSEYFIDEKFFDKGEWIKQSDSIVTPDFVSGTAQAESVIFNSDQNVTGLQFSTVQSTAYQLLGNPDFTNLSTWDGYGDASVSISDKFNSVFGNLLQVSRQTATSSIWDGIEDRFATWNDIQSKTWDQIQLDPDGPDIGGVQYTEDIDVDTEERLYVAVRVYNENVLNVPLTIEIFHKTTGIVVDSESISVKGTNQTTEWFAEYLVGSAGVTTPYTWNDVVGSGISWDELDAEGTWDRVDHSYESLVGSLGVRVVQNAYSRDVFYVDNVSVFVDPIKWEFSNDGGTTYYEVSGIKNNPRGIFKFPNTGSQLRWRVSSKKSNAHVAGLVIRPVYDILPMGVPYRESIQFAGPNDSPYDHYLPILEDPWFKLWNKPVPQFWWISQRKWLGAQGKLGLQELQ